MSTRRIHEIQQRVDRHSPRSIPRPRSKQILIINHVTNVMSQDRTEDVSLNEADSGARVEKDLPALLRIVKHAHRNTELGVEEAIRSASDARFNDLNIDIQTRARIRDWLLTKVAPGAPPTDLFGHFERVLLNEAGITLQFDQPPNARDSQEHRK